MPKPNQAHGNNMWFHHVEKTIDNCLFFHPNNSASKERIKTNYWKRAFYPAQTETWQRFNRNLQLSDLAQCGKNMSPLFRMLVAEGGNIVSGS